MARLCGRSGKASSNGSPGFIIGMAGELQRISHESTGPVSSIAAFRWLKSVMIRKMLLTMAVSFAVLTVPNWKPPCILGKRDSAFRLDWVLWTAFLLLLLILNRLVNASFRFKVEVARGRLQ